ncbi:39S ribosomal protein L44, mitochondrial [Lecanora helva]
MITKHLTEVITKFNPFTKTSKTCRVFLANLPANARTTMKVNTTVLPRESQEPSSLWLKFKDGKEMQLDTERLRIGDVEEEVDRHSRMLNRKAELAG